MTGKEKSQPSTSTSTKSKKNVRKVAKNAPNTKKLINFTSEENSSASDTENVTDKVKSEQYASCGPLNKRNRTVNKEDMKQDFATSPSSPSASSTTSTTSSNTKSNTAA